MAEYLRLEQEAADLTGKQKELLEVAKNEKRDMTSSERDSFFQMQGAAQSLEATARVLRDAELEDLKRTAQAPVAAPSVDDQAVTEFMNYMKTGSMPQNSVTSTDAAGGFIIPEPIQKGLVEKVRLRNPIMANATVFNSTGDIVINLPRKVSHGVVTYAAETGARTEQTAPTFGSVSLTAYDHFTDQRATAQWMDSVAGSQDLMLNWIAEDLAEDAEWKMVQGSGTTESAGFFKNTGASGYHVDLTTTSGVVANTDLFQLYFTMAPKYRSAGKWYMAGGTLAGLTTKSHPGAADTPLVTMQGDGTPYIFGKEVVEVESASSTASGEYPIAFADMANAYAVIVHRGISVLVDPYTATPYTRFYGLIRCGGAPWDRQAAVLLRSSKD